MKELLKRMQLRCGNDGNVYELYDGEYLLCRKCGSMNDIDNIGEKIIDDVKYTFTTAIQETVEKLRG